MRLIRRFVRVARVAKLILGEVAALVVEATALVAAVVLLARALGL